MAQKRKKIRHAEVDDVSETPKGESPAKAGPKTKGKVQPPPLPGPPPVPQSSKAKSKTKTAKSGSHSQDAPSAPSASAGTDKGQSGSRAKVKMPEASVPEQFRTAKPSPTPSLHAEVAAQERKAAAKEPPNLKPPAPPPPVDTETDSQAGSQRRSARRRPAGPVRNRIAANDDAPSIGGLIYALEQKPSSKPFKYAAIGSCIWAVLGIGFAWLTLSKAAQDAPNFSALLVEPVTFLTLTAVLVPIAVIWFLALLGWRAEELRLRSSTMAEVAIRLAEPDKMAEQSVASVGQAVRRQISFMNDAVTQALGRAGELEALVHNEVAALERSYDENEHKIRSLIQELSGERNMLLNTSERVTYTLKGLGEEVPALIEKLSSQQSKLAGIIQGAGENLTALETSLGASANHLETTLNERTTELQNVLGDNTTHMHELLANYTTALATAMEGRSDNLQTVFEEYAQALDTTLANRAQALDMQLVERTKALDEAFSQRLMLFDESIQKSTTAIDGAVGDKTHALTSALENHARTFQETIATQATDLDESLMHGINAVRRTSENITRQSLKAIEGLASQSDLLKNVSENLLTQINTVTNRFENQGQSILQAANSLEGVNHKIDTTLQARHHELSSTLDRMSGKADEFGRFVEGYSSQLEGQLTEAERRARSVAEELRRNTQAHQQEALADLERLKLQTDTHSAQALEDLRQRFSNVSSEFTSQIGTLASQVDQSSAHVRERAAQAREALAQEQERLTEELASIPVASRESADAMRRALQDQLRALEQLSNLTSRTAAQRDVSPPVDGGTLGVAPQPGSQRALSALTTSSAPSQNPLRQAPQRPVAAPLTNAPVMTRPAPSAQAPVQTAAGPGPSPIGGEQREGWSLGDLLKRASEDEAANARARREGVQAAESNAGPFRLNVDVISKALDPATAGAIWSRLRSGQRGVLVRSIYSSDGRDAFDHVCQRLQSDPELQATVAKYVDDFQGILKGADAQDPSGRMAQEHVVSDTGRVYLFLAHASGRLG